MRATPAQRRVPRSSGWLLAAPLWAGSASAEAPAGVEAGLWRWLETSCAEPGSAPTHPAGESWFGAAAVEPAFAELEGGSTGPTSGDGPPCDPGVRRSLLLALLESLPRDAVRARALQAGGSDASEAERIVALEVLGRLAARGVLADMVHVASGAGRSRDVERAFQAALETALQAAPGLRGELRYSAREVPAELVPSAARAVASCGDATDLATLGKWLGAGEVLDALVLEEIVRLAKRVGPPFDERVVTHVRLLVDSVSPELQAAAAAAAGALRDPAAVPSLLALLDAPGAAVRGRARDALTSICGVRLGPDAQRWQSWYAAEETWWREEFPAVRADLRAGSRPAVAAAIRAAAGHRLYRDELAAAIAPTLGDPHSRLMACVALRELGSRVAAPALVDCLSDRDEQVREQAWSALRSMYGLDLPPGPEAWRVVVEKR